MLPRMKKWFKKLWAAYKNVGAVRGLLQWVGAWTWLVGLLVAAGTWIWGRIINLAGPEQFVLALAAFVFVVAGIVIVRLLYLAFANNPGPTVVPETKAGKPDVLPVGSQSTQILGAILFDYLPVPPTQKGWTKAYKADGIAKFGTDGDIDNSLKMEVTQSEFAMDYTVPVHATLANRLIYTAKYDNSANIGAATMIFAFVEVSARSGEPRKRLWIKFYFGEKRAFPTPSVWHEPLKQLAEQTVYWPAVPLPTGKLKFDIDLSEAVTLTIGPEGWVYKGIYKIRLRGNLSISPIEFAS
jgi:hypothetical protein